MFTNYINSKKILWTIQVHSFKFIMHCSINRAAFALEPSAMHVFIFSVFVCSYLFVHICCIKIPNQWQSSNIAVFVTALIFLGNEFKDLPYNLYLFSMHRLYNIIIDLNWTRAASCSKMGLGLFLLYSNIFLMQCVESSLVHKVYFALI